MGSDRCDGCGSDLADRERAVKAAAKINGTEDGLTTDLFECPRCYAWKCIVCDMGDDVACPSCGDEGRE